jgi:translation initiation factor IF-3
MYKDNFRSNTPPHFKKNFPRRNQSIYSSEVLLISSRGENLGVKSKEEAIKMAEDEGYDLIEINPNSKPPICKIMDYSKYVYEKNKKQKKTKVREMKELRFSPVIETHDIEVRVSRAKKFLSKGHNVKLTIFRKGRQTTEQAKEIMAKLLTIFADYSTIEPEPKEEGRKLYITIKSDGKTKDKKNSNKEIKGNQSEGKQEEQDTLQEERTTPPKDKIIEKIKEKKIATGSSTQDNSKEI